MQSNYPRDAKLCTRKFDYFTSRLEENKNELIVCTAEMTNSAVNPID